MVLHGCFYNIHAYEKIVTTQWKSTLQSQQHDNNFRLPTSHYVHVFIGIYTLHITNMQCSDSAFGDLLLLRNNWDGNIQYSSTLPVLVSEVS